MLKSPKCDFLELATIYFRLSRFKPDCETWRVNKHRYRTHQYCWPSNKFSLVFHGACYLNHIPGWLDDLTGEFQNMVKVVDKRRKKERKEKIFVILIDGVG